MVDGHLRRRGGKRRLSSVSSDRKLLWSDHWEIDKDENAIDAIEVQTLEEVEFCDGLLSTMLVGDQQGTNERLYGNMFNVRTSQNRLFVNGFDIVSDLDQVEFEVYTRKGSFENGQMGVDGWDLVDMGSVKVQMGVASIRWEAEVTIEQQTLQAFYITFETMSMSCNHGFEHAAGESFVSNENLNITLGVGVTYPLSDTTNIPVIFSGTIYYTAQGICPTTRDSAGQSSEVGGNQPSLSQSSAQSEPLFHRPNRSPLPSLSSVPSVVPSLTVSPTMVGSIFRNPSFQPSGNPTIEKGLKSSPIPSLSLNPSSYESIATSSIPSFQQNKTADPALTILPSFSPSSNASFEPSSFLRENQSSFPTDAVNESSLMPSLSSTPSSWEPSNPSSIPTFENDATEDPTHTILPTLLSSSTSPLEHSTNLNSEYSLFPTAPDDKSSAMPSFRSSPAWTESRVPSMMPSLQGDETEKPTEIALPTVQPSINSSSEPSQWVGAAQPLVPTSVISETTLTPTRLSFSLTSAVVTAPSQMPSFFDDATDSPKPTTLPRLSPTSALTGNPTNLPIIDSLTFSPQPSINTGTSAPILELSPWPTSVTTSTSATPTSVPTAQTISDVPSAQTEPKSEITSNPKPSVATSLLPVAPTMIPLIIFPTHSLQSPGEYGPITDFTQNPRPTLTAVPLPVAPTSIPWIIFPSPQSPVEDESKFSLMSHRRPIVTTMPRTGIPISPSRNSRNPHGAPYSLYPSVGSSQPASFEPSSQPTRYKSGVLQSLRSDPNGPSPTVCALIPELCTPTGTPSSNAPSFGPSSDRTNTEPTSSPSGTNPSSITRPTNPSNLSPSSQVDPIRPSSRAPARLPFPSRAPSGSLPSGSLAATNREPTRAPISQPTRNPPGSAPSSVSDPNGLSPTVCVLIPDLCTPTGMPSSNSPSLKPSSERPNIEPTRKPSDTTPLEVSRPSSQIPTDIPSRFPSDSPPSSTRNPTRRPTRAPNEQPTRAPAASTPSSSMPTRKPSQDPNFVPTRAPATVGGSDPTRSLEDQPSREPSPAALSTTVPIESLSRAPTQTTPANKPNSSVSSPKTSTTDLPSENGPPSFLERPSRAPSASMIPTSSADQAQAPNGEPSRGPTFSVPGIPSVPNFLSSVSLPNFPSVAIPNLPSLSVPGFPSLSVPNLPSVSLPNVPSVVTPVLPSISVPGIPSLSVENLPSVSLPNLPSVVTPSLPSISVPGSPLFSVPNLQSVSLPGALAISPTVCELAPELCTPTGTPSVSSPASPTTNGSEEISPPSRVPSRPNGSARPNSAENEGPSPSQEGASPVPLRPSVLSRPDAAESQAPSPNREFSRNPFDQTASIRPTSRVPSDVMPSTRPVSAGSRTIAPTGRGSRVPAEQSLEVICMLVPELCTPTGAPSISPTEAPTLDPPTSNGSPNSNGRPSRAPSVSSPFPRPGSQTPPPNGASSQVPIGSQTTGPSRSASRPPTGSTPSTRPNQIASPNERPSSILSRPNSSERPDSIGEQTSAPNEGTSSVPSEESAILSPIPSSLETSRRPITTVPISPSDCEFVPELCTPTGAPSLDGVPSLPATDEPSGRRPPTPNDRPSASPPPPATPSEARAPTRNPTRNPTRKPTTPSTPRPSVSETSSRPIATVPISPSACEFVPELCTPTGAPSLDGVPSLPATDEPSGRRPPTPNDRPSASPPPTATPSEARAPTRNPTRNPTRKPTTPSTPRPSVSETSSRPIATVPISPSACEFVPELCTPTGAPSLDGVPSLPATDEPSGRRPPTPNDRPSASPPPTATPSEARAPTRNPTRNPTRKPTTPSTPRPSVSETSSRPIATVPISPSACEFVPELCTPTGAPSLDGVPSLPATDEPSGRRPPTPNDRPSASPPPTATPSEARAPTRNPTRNPTRKPTTPSTPRPSVSETSSRPIATVPISPSACEFVPELCTPTGAPSLDGVPSLPATDEPSGRRPPTPNDRPSASPPPPATPSEARAPTRNPTRNPTRKPTTPSTPRPSVSETSSRPIATVPISPSACEFVPELCTPTGAPSLDGVPSLPATDEPSGRRPPTPNDRPSASPPPTATPSEARAPTRNPTRNPTRKPTTPSTPRPNTESDTSRQPTRAPTTEPARIPSSLTARPVSLALSPTICQLVPELCNPTSTPSSFSPSLTTVAPTETRRPASTRRPSPPPIESEAPSFSKSPSTLSPQALLPPSVCWLIPDLCSSTSAPSAVPPTASPSPSLSQSSAPSSFAPTFLENFPSLFPSDNATRRPTKGSSSPQRTLNPDETPTASPSIVMESSSLSPTDNAPTKRSPVPTTMSPGPLSFQPSQSTQPSQDAQLSQSSQPSQPTVCQVLPLLCPPDTLNSQPTLSPSLSLESARPSGSALSSLQPSRSGQERPSEPNTSAPTLGGSSQQSLEPSLEETLQPSISRPSVGTPILEITAEPAAQPILSQGIERSCPGFENGQAGTVEQNVDFSYTIQTSSLATAFVSDIENVLLQNVSDQVLTCNESTGLGRRLQEGNAMIYSLRYPDADKVSTIVPCTPTEPTAVSCWTIESVFLVSVTDNYEAKASQKVLQAVERVFDDGQDIEGAVPDVVFYEYAPSTSNPSPTDQPQAVDNGVPVSLIAGMSALGLLIVLGAAFFFYRRARKKAKRQNISQVHYDVDDAEDNSAFGDLEAQAESENEKYEFDDEIFEEQDPLLGETEDSPESYDDEDLIEEEKQLPASEGSESVDEVDVATDQVELSESLAENKLVISQEGIVSGFLDPETALSVGSDITDHYAYDGAPTRFEDVFTMPGSMFASAASNRNSLEDVMFSFITRTSDEMLIRSLLWIPIINTFLGNIGHAIFLISHSADNISEPVGYDLADAGMPPKGAGDQHAVERYLDAESTSDYLRPFSDSPLVAALAIGEPSNDGLYLTDDNEEDESPDSARKYLSNERSENSAQVRSEVDEQSVAVSEATTNHSAQKGESIEESGAFSKAESLLSSQDNNDAKLGAHSESQHSDHGSNALINNDESLLFENLENLSSSEFASSKLAQLTEKQDSGGLHTEEDALSTSSNGDESYGNVGADGGITQSYADEIDEIFDPDQDGISDPDDDEISDSDLDDRSYDDHGDGRNEVLVKSLEEGSRSSYKHASEVDSYHDNDDYDSQYDSQDENDGENNGEESLNDIPTSHTSNRRELLEENTIQEESSDGSLQHDMPQRYSYNEQIRNSTGVYDDEEPYSGSEGHEEEGYYESHHEEEGYYDERQHSDYDENDRALEYGPYHDEGSYDEEQYSDDEAGVPYQAQLTDRVYDNEQRSASDADHFENDEREFSRDDISSGQLSEQTHED